ncbi:PAS domain-containing sensor histidine kinase [Leeia aquatica]|uniref:histidine kinase n=1 Tax=Leeia aquatica TaxID=2725557 RepID=A0A847RYG6_9NEIS|nr:ATP-binding protein [Leeia aquatica]NLR74761.1 PAS domain S-box protein [Leeia aquatica]
MAFRFHTRWLWAMPNLVLLLFLLAAGGFVYLLQHNELGERRDALIVDALWQEQTLRLHLESQRNQLIELAHATQSEGLDEDQLSARSLFLLSENPEIMGMVRQDSLDRSLWVYPPLANAALDSILSTPEARQALRQAHLTGRPAYSTAIFSPTREYVFVLYAPISDGKRYAGALASVHSLKGLLEQQVPWWIANKYQISIVDLDGKGLAAKFDQRIPGSDLSHELAFDPPGGGLRMRATSYQQASPILQRALLWVLIGLAGVMLWSMWALRRHIRQRLEAERALRQEMSLRRAMEDSLVSGMRAMDMHGKLIYVNRAFCEMVGLSSEQLLDQQTPMPYWAPEAQDDCAAIYQSILAGQCPPNGYTARFMRQDGERFDVRIYASPLIDSQGKQSGWMSSLYDITELKREREALKASHERFMTVLDGLDAMVTVVDPDSHEVLFSNQRVRTWLRLASDSAYCIIPLLPLPYQHDDGEAWDAIGQRWYHIQRRLLLWVDGRPAWLSIATDLTVLRSMQEREQQQAQQLQHTARLISMGEMASSLAHELNQPLAAISSYSTGCQNLLEQGTTSPEALRLALGKISEQARRAGGIIRGIREFVQRREPKLGACQLNDMIDNVLSLLSAELRHTGTQVRYRLVSLPDIQADRVMLEQVLFNLAKNAIEAMTNRPAYQRKLTLISKQLDHHVCITVADRGPGLSEAEKQQLFTAFYTTKAQGMGMGLNICRSIVEYHQGRLWVEDNPGGGCRFSFTLPLPPREVDHVETA